MQRVLLLLIAGLLLGQQVFAEQDQDATAKFLAGLPVRGTSLENLSLQPEWPEHAAELDRAWSRLEQEQLSKIRNWTPQFLGNFYNDTAPLFYFFSGPDFLYANAFFPNAQAYILCGTESVGAIPDIASVPREALPGALANLRKSLDSVLSWSFFITKQMKTDLAQSYLSGTLPILYVFIARAGDTIQSTSLISLDSSGNVVDPGKGKTTGVKIILTNSRGANQTIYYFSTDLSNDGIKAAPEFIKFCRKQVAGLSLLKAASYLMHENGFSEVRDFLLGQSKLILQDDSGIPLHFFDDKIWNLRFFGNYTGPIEVFKQYWQADLANVSANTTPAPLGFGFGYVWRPDHSALMVATRK